MSEDCPVPTDCLSTLKSTVDSVMSQSEATKNLLNTILKGLGPMPGLLNATAPNLTRWPQSHPPAPIPTLTAGWKKTFLKPSTPSDFDGNCKGNCGPVSLRVEMSKSGRGSKVRLLMNRHRY
jgi:hypothetical protein